MIFKKTWDRMGHSGAVEAALQMRAIRESITSHVTLKQRPKRLEMGTMWLPGRRTFQMMGPTVCPKSQGGGSRVSQVRAVEDGV